MKINSQRLTTGREMKFEIEYEDGLKTQHDCVYGLCVLVKNGIVAVVRIIDDPANAQPKEKE